MQISIRPPTFMWFLPKSTIHLTDENPGPIDINFQELSKESQKCIILGLQKNQITCSEELSVLQAIHGGQQQVYKVPVLANVEEEEAHNTVSEYEVNKIASDRLNQTLNYLQKYIAGCNDIRLLRVMLELESNTRDRKHVIENINDKLESLSLAVQKHISKSAGPAARPQDPLADSYSVIETQERVVEVPKEQ